MAEPDPAPERRPARRRSRIVATAVAVAVVAAVYAYALPRFANYGAVWSVVRMLDVRWGIALAAAVGINVLTFAPPWMVVLTGLRLLDALRLTQASTAFGLVVPGGAPIGMAVSFAMLRIWRFRPADVGLAVALTGLWNQGSTFLFPVLAVLLLAVEGVGASGLLAVSAVGVVLALGVAAVVGAALGSPRLARIIGDRGASFVSRVQRVRRGDPVAWNGETLVRVRARSLALLRRRWHLLTLATAVNQVTGFVLLDLSLRAMGIERGQVSLSESFAAWSFGRLLTSLPITPGGAGVVEVGLVGTLVGFGGPRTPVVAAVLVYRFVSVVPTLALGAIAALSWRVRPPAPE